MLPHHDLRLQFKAVNTRVDTIMDYGRGLVEELKKVRNTEEVRSATRYDSREENHVNG